MAAGVSVPRVFEQTTVEGRPGLVLERVSGLDGLTAAQKRPWRIWSIGTATGRLHRQLAQVTAPEGLPTAKEIARWEITNSPSIPEAARPRLLAILEQAPEGTSLCHFDFHPGNVMESASGLVIIDFANAAAGDPVADHAKSLLLLEVGDPAEVSPWERVVILFGRRLMRAAYRHGYGQTPPEAVRAWWPIVIAHRLHEGIPEERKRLLQMLARALRKAEAA
jgi:aminoglycoside phosphotransferase (APT) family kinase protein